MDGSTIDDMDDGRRQVCFDTPDAAYLVAAALHKHPEAARYSDVLLVPSERGPSLDVPSFALEDPVVTELVELFEGVLMAETGR